MVLLCIILLFIIEVLIPFYTRMFFGILTYIGITHMRKRQMNILHLFMTNNTLLSRPDLKSSISHS